MRNVQTKDMDMNIENMDMDMDMEVYTTCLCMDIYMDTGDNLFGKLGLITQKFVISCTSTSSFILNKALYKFR
jgi:hypothetical protein